MCRIKGTGQVMVVAIALLTIQSGALSNPVASFVGTFITSGSIRSRLAVHDFKLCWETISFNGNRSPFNHISLSMVLAWNREQQLRTRVQIQNGAINII
jgi:hypothetical protein